MTLSPARNEQQNPMITNDEQGQQEAGLNLITILQAGDARVAEAKKQTDVLMCSFIEKLTLQIENLMKENAMLRSRLEQLESQRREDRRVQESEIKAMKQLINTTGTRVTALEKDLLKSETLLISVEKKVDDTIHKVKNHISYD